MMMVSEVLFPLKHQNVVHYSIIVAVIGFEKLVYSGRETDQEIQVSVGVVQGELSSPVVVRIFTANGTALSDSDYQSVNQTLTFSPINTTITISVPILDDQVDEDQEFFIVKLILEPLEEQQNVQIQPDEATVFVEDNEGKFK